jgi:signal transduction histidine kinase
MSATTAQHAPLSRSTDDFWLGGVAAGLARRLGVAPAWTRLAFVVATVAGGFGIPIYALAWALLPDDGGDARSWRLRTGRGAVEIAAGSGLLVIAALLAVRATGLTLFSDLLVWPIALVVAGGALIWRTSQSSPPPAQKRGQSPILRGDEAAEPVIAERAGWAAAVVSRTGVGIALVIGAAVVFLQAAGALGAVRDVALSALVVAVALGVIFAPWIIRLVRSLSAERAERIRSQERAEVAAHLHDSVLQTLALVQKRADDPRGVAQLARRQERELRDWLFDRKSEGMFRDALEQAAAEVEEQHGATVDVVAVGDRELDERTSALVAAAREAMVNAARHGGGAVSVYAEANGDRTSVFVRDRGQGFVPDAVPPDRKGIQQSIIGRMERHGGRATIQSQPGQGTEVELSL